MKPQHPRGAPADSEIVFPVIGLRCNGCARRVETRLRRIPGVREANVSTALERAAVRVGSGTPVEKVVETLARAGYDPRRARARLPFVDSTWAIASTRFIEERVRAMPGVVACRVDRTRQEVEIDFVPQSTGIDVIRRRIEHCGYETSHPTAHPDGDVPAPRRHERALTSSLAVALVTAALATLVNAAGSGGLLARYGVPTPGPMAGALLWMAALGGLLYSMRPHDRVLLGALKNRCIDMRHLSILAILALMAGALVEIVGGLTGTGLVAAALWIATIERASEAADRLLERRTTSFAHTLFDALPHRTRVRRNDGVREIDAGELVPGDRVMVNGPESIPADGRIASGSLTLDESLFSLGRREAVVGERVLSGTKILSGEAEIEVTRAAGRSVAVLAGDLLEETRGKANLEHRGERLARRGIHFALVSSITAAAMTLLVGGSAGDGLVRMAGLLVAFALPSFGIAAAAAVTVARDLAARRGVLMDSNTTVENLGSLDSVTLLDTAIFRGEPRVTNSVMLDGISPARLLELAATALRDSGLPIAGGIVRRVAPGGAALPDGVSRQIPGGGVTWVAGNLSVVVGSPVAFQAKGIDLERIEEEIEAYASQGKLPVCVAVDGRVAGLLALELVTKPEEAAAIADLRRLGLKVRMLTTMYGPAANVIGQRAGFDSVRSEPFAERLALAIGDPRESGRSSAVLVPPADTALGARSRVSIALGISEDDSIPLRSAVTILDGSLRSSVDAIRIARAALGAARTSRNMTIAGCLAGIALATGAPALIGGPGPSAILPALAAALTTGMVHFSTARLRKGGER